MNCSEIIDRLGTMGSEKYRQNVVRMGIPEANSLGVPTGELRKLARELGKSQELALELWDTGYHEAKLLAVLLMEVKKMDGDQVERLMSDVESWDLCDHLCKNIIMKIPDYQLFIERWCGDRRTYYKRAAYTLVAAAVIHDKKTDNDQIDRFLDLIREQSDDDRTHVKKALSFALKEIGKKDFDCQEKAVILAHDLMESGSKEKAWVGKDAAKELENLVRAEGRSRLITSKSQMGGGQ